MEGVDSDFWLPVVDEEDGVKLLDVPVAPSDIILSAEEDDPNVVEESRPVSVDAAPAEAASGQGHIELTMLVSVDACPAISILKPTILNQFCQNKSNQFPKPTILNQFCQNKPNQFPKPTISNQLSQNKPNQSSQLQQPYTQLIKKEPPPYQSSQPQIIKKESPPPNQFTKPKLAGQFMGAKPQTSGLSFQPPPLNTSQFGGKKIERIPVIKLKDQSGTLTNSVGGPAPWKK
jgi:hypothetical protein